MDTKKVLASLCYFSIFFAGFIFPIIIYFVSDDRELKHHAKSALLSHILPVIMILVVIGGVFLDIGILASGGIPPFMLITIILSAIVSIGVTIWNVYKGIKVLM